MQGVYRKRDPKRFPAFFRTLQTPAGETLCPNDSRPTIQHNDIRQPSRQDAIVSNVRIAHNSTGTTLTPLRKTVLPAAHGWPVMLTGAELLERLLALSHQRAGERSDVHVQEGTDDSDLSALWRNISAPGLRNRVQKYSE
jgi:hypothetical protein